MNSLGLTGILGSAAGAPLSQTSGSTTERTQREAAAVQRHADADAKAEQAGGIGQTEQDEQTDERDADGRRLWERTARQSESPREDGSEHAPPRSKDSTGASGNALDLLG